MRSIGVLTGGFSSEELLEAGASKVFDIGRGAAPRSGGHDPAGLNAACRRLSGHREAGTGGVRLTTTTDAAMDTLEATSPVAPPDCHGGVCRHERRSRVAMTSVPAGRPEDGPSRSEEDRRLLIRYHRHGDQAAREQLVQRLLPLARRMARRYRRSDEPLDDLVQVATLGLIKAIDRFDPARETAFSLLRGADDARRAQALLPRQRLGGARPARDAGARDAGRQRDEGPLAQARPLAVRGRGRRRR